MGKSTRKQTEDGLPIFTPEDADIVASIKATEDGLPIFVKKKEGPSPAATLGSKIGAAAPVGGGQPISPSTSTSTSPLPLFGSPKKTPQDKIGQQVQQNEEKRRRESFDDVEASFKEVMELQRSVSTETDTKIAVPYATANSMDAVRLMKERDKANLQLAQQRKDALLKEKGDVLFAPVRELIESGKSKDFFDASGNFKTGKAIEYFSGVVGEKGGGAFTRQLLVNTLRKEGATLSQEQKADLKKNTDAGVKSVAGRVGLAKKSMVAGWYQTLANYGHKMASEGIDNALSRYLQSKDYDYQQWAPGQYEWNGKEWIDRAITSGGQSIGGSLPSLIPSTIATVATGGLAGTVIGAGIGYTGEKASITGSIYDQVLQQTGDPALARKKADEVGHALEITAPAYLLSSAATLKTFKPGSIGAKALGFGLEAAEEYPVEFYQGWQEAKATQGYKGSLTDYVQENPETALDILVATTGQSTGIAVAGKILRTLNAKTPAARNQLYADIVSKHGVDFGLAVIDQHYQSGELSEEGFAKEKAELLQTAEQLKAFEGLGIKGEDAKAYVAVSKQVQDLKGKLGATEDPTLRSALEIKIKQAEKNLGDIVGGKGAYAVITYPGGAGQTAVIPLTDLQGMERSGEIDELVKAADQIEIVGDEALNKQYQERKKALGTPEAPEGFYSKPSVILPSENKRSGEMHTIAPKKEEPSKTAPAVIKPSQNKPAPVTTIAPKQVEAEPKGDTRPSVILPSANKAPSVTTVSPQSPSSAPMVNGAAQRGEMQVPPIELPAAGNRVHPDNTKAGDTVYDSDGNAYEVVGFGKSRKGADVVELKNAKRTDEDLLQSARETVWARNRNYYPEGITEEFLKDFDYTIKQEFEQAKHNRDNSSGNFTMPLEEVSRQSPQSSSPQSPPLSTVPQGTGVEERGEMQAQTVKVYRAGKKKGDVTFYSKTEGYAHEYNDFFLNGEAEVTSEDITFENPLVVELTDEEFTDINAQKPHISKAKKAGHDVVIFRNSDPEGGYAGEEFYAVIKSNQGKKAESPISSSQKESSERGETQEAKKERFREAILTALESANGSEFSEVISDIALQDSDRKTAVKNIRKGKSTVATKKVEEAIEKMWQDGYVYLNRGRGAHTESYQMPIEEFLDRLTANDEAFQELSQQAQNLQQSLDALGEDLFGETVEEVVEEVRGEMPMENKKTFDLGGQTTFYHASSKPRVGRLRMGTAPGFGTGVYFSTNRDRVVKEFGNEVTEVELTIENPVRTSTREWYAVQRRAIQMADEAYAKRKGLTPEDIDEDLGYYKYDPDDDANFYEIDANHVSDAAKEMGYDAIIEGGTNVYGNEIVVLDESKIIYPEDKTHKSPQSNEPQSTDSLTEDTGTPPTPAEGSNEANRTTGSPAPPVEGNKEQKTGVDRFEAQEVIPYRSVEDNTYKPEEQLKFNQGQYFEAVRLVGDPDLIELIQIGSRRHYNLTHSSGKKPVNEARQKQLEDQFGVSAYELYQKAREMAKANRSKTDEVIVVIGEKGSLAPKATPKQKKAGTYEAKARKLAQKLDNMKMPDWFSVKDPNVKKMGLDAESMKKAFKAIIIDTGILLDKGVEAGEALRRGAEAMVAFVEEGYQKIGGKLKEEAAEAIRAGFTRDAAKIFGVAGDGTPPADTKAEEDDASNPTRRFSRRVIKDESILKGVKPGVEAAMEYTRQTNAMSVQEASEVIERVGADDAYDLVVNDKGLKPAVRVVLGQMLIKKYNQMAEEAAAAGDTERENRYLDRTIDVANYVSEKFGTEAGQMIQALSLFERLTPEAQLRAAQKEVKAIGKKKAERRRKDIEEVGKKLQAANEEAAEELTQSPRVKKAVEKTETERVKKAKDKIEAARKKRENLIKKFRGDKGKNLYSTPGLTNEGIEFVGEMALTYLAEGVANVEIIADKILSEMKALTGKVPSEGVVRQVGDIVREQADRLIDKKTAQGLRELEAAINKIVREHYTVSDETKTALIDKFVAQTGMDKAEALALAETIQQEFERIATRKKRDILEAERSRLQKIQKDLDRTEGRHPRELQDEIIKFSNLGALDSEEFFDMVAQKLGVGKLTQKEAKEIKALAERIQKAPEGSPRNEATQDLLAYRANLKGSSFMELSQAVWFANILSGWKTHAVNIVSTFINGVGTFGAEAVRDPRSIPVMLYGAARGTRRGFFEAAHTLITGRSPIHIRKVETPSTLERHQFTGKLSFLNWAKYVLRVMAAEDVVGFQGLKEMRATQLAYREARKQGSGSPFSRKTWAIIERELLNTKERSEAAIAQAEGEGFTKGTRRDFVAWKRRVYELMELSRPVQMTDEAYGFAAKGTFNHPPEGLLGALTNLMTVALDLDINGSRPLRYFVPFTRIIANVVNANLDYTPVGFLRAWRGKRGVESLENNSWTAGAYKELSQEERAQLVAKASLGLIFTAALYTLSHVEDDEGEPLIDITGAGTGNFERDEQLRQTGWQPFSVKVGGVWYSYKYTPLIFNLSLIGHINDHEKYKADDEETFMYKLMLAAFQTGQQVLDGTFLGSTSAVMETLAQDDPKRMAGGFGGTMAKLATQTVVPNLPIQGAQAVEEILSLNQKDAKNAFTRLQQHIPYARNLMNDKVNALGEPIPTDTYGFISFEEPHPVFDFLINEKKAWVARVNPNTFMVYDEKKGEERLGTPEEYYKFARLRGQKIKAEVENIMQNGAFVTYDENDKEVVTLNEDEARDVKPASQITSKEMKQLVRALSVRATKEAKEELFSPEW